MVLPPSKNLPSTNSSTPSSSKPTPTNLNKTQNRFVPFATIPGNQPTHSLVPRHQIFQFDLSADFFFVLTTWCAPDVVGVQLRTQRGEAPRVEAAQLSAEAAQERDDARLLLPQRLQGDALQEETNSSLSDEIFVFTDLLTPIHSVLLQMLQQDLSPDQWFAVLCALSPTRNFSCARTTVLTAEHEVWSQSLAAIKVSRMPCPGV